MYLYKPRNSEGKQSPFWAAQIRGPSTSGRIISIGTKIRMKAPARRLAEVWQRSAELARQGWLDTDKARQLLDECARICRGDPYLVSERFVGECLKFSTNGDLVSPTVEQYFNSWLEDKTAKGQTATGTIERYRPILKRFLSTDQTDRKLSAVTTQDLKTFLLAEQTRGVSAVTGNLFIKVLRILFNTAVREGVIRTNPANAVTLFRTSPDSRLAFTDEQVQTMYQVASIEWRGMILFAYQAGLRISDCASLTWANIDLDRRVLTYIPRKTARKRNGKSTAVRFHPEIAEYLESLPGSDDPNGPLFPILSKKSVSSASGLSALFKRDVMTQAGIVSPKGSEKTGDGHRLSCWSFHSLRHSFISRMADAEIGSDVRLDLAGHASEQIHRGYLHANLERQDQALQKLGRAA